MKTKRKIVSISRPTGELDIEVTDNFNLFKNVYKIERINRI